MGAEAGTGAAAIAAETLWGVWELVSWTRVDADGTVTYPFSDRASGRLIYHPEGWMSGFLMDPAHLEAPPGGARTVMTYTARYRLDGEIVVHDVDIATDRNMIGVALRRRVVRTAEGMVLETLAPVGRAARDSVHRLAWRRPA